MCCGSSDKGIARTGPRLRAMTMQDRYIVSDVNKPRFEVFASWRRKSVLMLSELRKSWLEMLSLHFRRTVAHTHIAFSQHFSPVLFLSSILTRSIYPITYLFRTQLFELCVCFVVRISRTRAGKREEARSASTFKSMHRFTFRCYHIRKTFTRGAQY
jgi:hypothetical protein